VGSLSAAYGVLWPLTARSFVHLPRGLITTKRVSGLLVLPKLAPPIWKPDTDAERSIRLIDKSRHCYRVEEGMVGILLILRSIIPGREPHVYVKYSQTFDIHYKEEIHLQSSRCESGIVILKKYMNA
jgi:hypothetical protein